MRTLFLMLTAFNLLCLALAVGVGYWCGGSTTSQMHPLSGVAAMLICIAVHCVVFTYFIATAKWIQHAVQVKQLDPALLAPTRSFKRQAFPAALGAMAMVFATALTGAATISYGLNPLHHHTAAWLTLLTNAAVAMIEWRAMVRNGELIREILGRIHAVASV